MAVTSPPVPTELPGFPPVRFDTRAGFQQNLLSTLATAEREIRMADADFSKWPVNSPAFEAALRTFFSGSRANRVLVLAGAANRLTQEAPRFVRLVREHAHAMQVRYPPEHLALRFGNDFSLLLVDQARLLRRFHRDTLRGVVLFDPNEARAWTDAFQQLWDESTPGLTATTLGLAR